MGGGGGGCEGSSRALVARGPGERGEGIWKVQEGKGLGLLGEEKASAPLIVGVWQRSSMHVENGDIYWRRNKGGR